MQLVIFKHFKFETTFTASTEQYCIAGVVAGVVVENSGINYILILLYKTFSFYQKYFNKKI